MHPASKLNAYTQIAFQLMKEFLFDTEVACCESYFPGSATCRVNSLEGNLWYPDWSTAGKGCLNDGNEKPYMKVNPTHYMFATYEICCRTLFGWDLENCFESSTGLVTSLSSGSSSSSSSNVQGLWSPDWRPSATTCLNDGNEKPYMVVNPSWYLYADFRECCERRFEWDVEGCIGSNLDPVTSSQVPLAVVQVVVCRVSGIQTGVPVPRHVLTMEMKNPIWWSTPPGTSTRPAGNAVNVVLNGTSRDAPDHMLIQSLAQPVVQALREPLEQVPIQPLVQALTQARGWPLRALAAV